MKKLYILLIGTLFLFGAGSGFAQQIGDLDGIYYQAVAIDDEGKEIVGMDIEEKPLYKKEIGVRFTITKGADGAIQWEETHTTTTDEYGLFTLIIGQGTPTGNAAYDRLLDIPWIEADQFLKVEISTDNDGDYKMVSNERFMTVPYAFYTDDIADNAITSEKILNEEVINEDIADATIDLTSKVTGILPVENGGTGLETVATGSILAGSGTNQMNTLAVNDSVMLFSNPGGEADLYKLRPGPRTSISVDDVTKTVTITALEQGGGPGTGVGDVSVPNIAPGEQVERNFPSEGVQPGDIILATIFEDLQGLTVSAYVRQAGQVRVIFFNGSAQNVDLGPVTVNFANFGQP